MQLNDNVYTYDTMNRLDTMSFTFDGQTALFDYAYDLVGRQTQSALTLNNVADRAINIEYDYLGRALSAELTGNALNDILAEFDYNAVGALTNVNRYEWDDNDDLYELIAKSNIQYNARNQITNITHADASNVAIAAHSYLFSPDGNITQYTNSIDGTVNYTNDFLGQLTGADYSNLDITDESYQYDINGNRELVTNANGDLVVYSTGLNNELNSDGNYSYTYDAEGNRISKINAVGTERELYSWDYRNRLSSVTKQTYDSVSETWQTVQIVEYAYDYNNVLIRKVLDANGDGTADSKTLFLPENYQTAIQLDDADLSDSTDATISHRYLWTPQNQDKLLADVTPTETLWTLTDHLGTIRDVIQQTPNGIIQKSHVIYDAYGNVLSCKDANGTDVSNPVLFGFTGKYFDADTQLQNNVNRWYDSIIGRWLSTDPIGFNGNDTNLYRYVGNHLLSYNDYYGYQRKAVLPTPRSPKMRIDEYIYLFNQENQNLSREEIGWYTFRLFRGCVGYTIAQCGYTIDLFPDMRRCFSTYEEAVAYRNYFKDKDMVIFGVKFYKNVETLPRLENGLIDIKKLFINDSKKEIDIPPRKPGGENYDFGFLINENTVISGTGNYNPIMSNGNPLIIDLPPTSNEDIGSFVTSTLEDWMKMDKQSDFNHQIWCVVCRENVKEYQNYPIDLYFK